MLQSALLAASLDSQIHLTLGTLMLATVTVRFFAWLRRDPMDPLSLLALTADPIYINSYTPFYSDTWTWAQATLVVPAPSIGVPGPLPALGVATAFGFSRRLRKRIKASASSPPSTSEA